VDGGLEEAFGLAIGSWRIGPGAALRQAQLLAGVGEAVGFIAWAVVCEDAADANAKPFVPGDGGGQEVGGTALGLIRIHGGEGEPRVVIDGNMQELRPDALNAVLAVAGDPVRRPLYAHQALDIQVQQVARSRMFVAIGRQPRLQVADAVQAQSPQHTADGGRAQAELLGDPHPVQRCRLSCSISMILSFDVPRGDRQGRELRSLNPATPCSR